MGGTKVLVRGEPDFLEPSPLGPVEGNGSGRQRRPDSSGLSSAERARHETPPHHPQAHGSLCSECPARADRPSEEAPGPAPSGFPLLPPQGHEGDQGGHLAEERSAEVGRAHRKRGGGRRRKNWVIRVRAIAPETYPKFMRYRDHPCANMEPEERLEDITTFCARLWARTCEDMARQRLLSKEVDGAPIKPKHP